MTLRTLLAALCFAAVPIFGCNAPNDTDSPDTTAVDGGPPKMESLSATITVSPTARLFLHSVPPFFDTHPVNANGIHGEYVADFLRQPGAGFGRMRIEFTTPQSNWVELLSDSLGATATGAGGNGQIEYDPVTESLTLGDGTSRMMRERVWLLQDRQLVSVDVETGPGVYLNSPKKQHELMQPKPKGAATPKRSLDEFEKEALEKLRAGDEVALRSDAHELRMLGAIRARKDCLACHKVEVGTMLGAFTYTLKLQSEETPAAARLTDKAGLTEQQLWAVRSIEAIGGKLTRAPGGAVTDVRLSYSRTQEIEDKTIRMSTRLQVRDSALPHLLAFPDVTVLDVSQSLVSDAGLKTLAELKNLKRLDLRLTSVTEKGVAELKKSLPKCEVLASPAVPLPTP